MEKGFVPLCENLSEYTNVVHTIPDWAVHEFIQHEDVKSAPVIEKYSIPEWAVKEFLDKQKTKDEK